MKKLWRIYKYISDVKTLNTEILANYEKEIIRYLLNFTNIHLHTILIKKYDFFKEEKSELNYCGMLTKQLIFNKENIQEFNLNNSLIGDCNGKILLECIKENCKNLSILNLENCGFTSEIGNIIGEAIGQQQNHLQELNLKNNFLKAYIGQCIFENIEQNCSNIMILNVINCGFTSKIGTSFANAIGKQRKLKELYISSNCLNDQIGKNLFFNIKENCTNISALNFDCCGFTSEIGDILGNGIGEQKYLVYLNGSDNEFGNDIGKNIFYNIKKNCSHLLTMNFWNCHFTSKIGNIVGDAIGQQTNIQHVSFYDNELGDDVGKHICLNIRDNCSDILTLSFESCSFTSEIGDVLGAAIGQQKNLRDLGIYENPFGDEVTKNLLTIIRENCKNITLLNIGDCTVTTLTSESITDIINDDNCLEELSIKNIKYEFDCAKDIFLSIENSCKSFYGLCFGNCYFPPELTAIFTASIIKQDRIKELYLWDNQLGNEGWKYVLMNLKNNCPILSTLDLTNCGISSDIGNVLGCALRKKRFMKELFLWDNQLEDDVGKHLFHCIKESHHTITILNIDNCGFTSNIGDILGDAIGQQYGLKELFCCNNHFEDKVGENIFENITKNCRKMTVIDCKNCGFTSKIGNSIGNAIGCQKYLTELHIANNQLGDKVGRNIFHNINNNCEFIKYLRAFNCGFTHQIGRIIGDAIGKQTNLHSIDVSENYFGDVIGKSIFANIRWNCSKLTKFGFGKCGFTSKIDAIIVDAIGQQTNLKSLYFWHNEVGDVIGNRIFQSVQQNCQKLSLFKIQKCRFSFHVGKIVCDAIGQQNDLEVLSICDNDFGDDIGKDLLEKIYKNCHKISCLTMGNCQFTSRIGNILPKAICQQKNLEILDISDNIIEDSIGTELFKSLENSCINLTKLDISNCGFTSEIGIILSDAIGQQTSLTSLIIQDNLLGDTIGKYLFSIIAKNNKKLELLNFSNCDFTTDVGYIMAEAIGSLKNLKILHCQDNKLGNYVGKHIFKQINENCRNIEKLICSNCRFTSTIGDIVGDAIGKQTNIKELSFWLNLLGDDVGKSIFQNIQKYCRNIKVLNFGNCQFTSAIGNIIGDAISEQKDLNYLYIWNNDFGDHLGRYIFENLQANCYNLTHLNVGGCRLTSNMGSIIGEVIGQQYNLQKLVMWENSLGDNVGEEIFNHLKENCKEIVYINCRMCNFTFQIGNCIGEAIGQQKHVKNFNMAENNLEDDVGRNIFENIKENCYDISILKFDNCGFTTDIGNILGDAIGQQHRLRELTFSNNQLGDAVGINLFNKLRENCFNIKIFKFDNCGFTANIGNILGDLIGQQNNLQILHVANNQFGNDVGKCLFQNIKKYCDNIYEIQCNNCGFTSKIGNVVYDAIVYHQQLNYLHIWNNRLMHRIRENLSSNILVRNRLG
ncbi:unnamed protein product [Dimorphilus gyrociliatus]|uniref:Uncharacterized protein n=1 Tax=Dimorphilus gyrociliatus TaxID=2664684 RepID=A0A7I8WFF3_9ANNE|nr:unnamed protein product [Dimorphilus gyrociliatus]